MWNKPGRFHTNSAYCGHNEETIPTVVRIFFTVSAVWRCRSILLLKILSTGTLKVLPALFFRYLVEQHKQIEHQADDEKLYGAFFGAAVEASARLGAESALSYDDHMKIESYGLKALEIEFHSLEWSNAENATP
ncbi:hypothetical protein MRX96_023676 [Rhipicephalus microplus]